MHADTHVDVDPGGISHFPVMQQKSSLINVESQKTISVLYTCLGKRENVFLCDLQRADFLFVSIKLCNL